VTASAPVDDRRQSLPATLPLRRVPVQGRSVARVERMLDACATLVDEVGYEGLTTTLLAERAGVAIGSVYQFFPDKRAVVQALTQRNLEAYLSRLTEQVASAGNGAHWWDGVETALDEYVRMHRTTPGFRTLHFGDVVDINLLDTSRDNNAVIADHLAGLLVDRFAVPDTDQLRFSLAVAVEAADALIKLAFRRDPTGEDRVVTEAKTLLREYLHRQLEPASTSGGKRRLAGKP
jgi:AcrR family transcriptional regulator